MPTVTINFTYYDNSAEGLPPAGDFSFVPPSIVIREESILTWNLNAVDDQGNPLSGATLEKVVFNSDSNWPGNPPAQVSPTQWAVHDPCEAAGNYGYIVEVGYQGDSFTGDPEADNEPD